MRGATPPYIVEVIEGNRPPYTAKCDSWDNSLSHIDDIGYHILDDDKTWFSSVFNRECYKCGHDLKELLSQ